MQCGYNADFRTDFEFRGEVGAIWGENYTQFDQEVTLHNQREDRDQWETIYNEDPYAAEIDAFAAVIRNQQKNPVPGEEGAKNQVVIDKILENSHA
jgi:predicted dehydrogenase